MNIQLLLTPYPLDRADLDGKTVVVVDVLRSSTTICASLLAGARGVIPVAEPGEAGELRAKLGPDSSVLAGERQGVKIENFQFGNSPTEFTPETVAGKNVILCTTNGTRVFGLTTGAGQVFSGALTNVSSVADALLAEMKDTVIVCSGREGGFSIEDTLCGGLLIDQLTSRLRSVTLNDAGSMARLLYRERKNSLHEAIAQGEHGRFLASIGLDGDVALCSQVDAMPILPVLKDGRLVRAESL
ncbi:MAG: 2-phosphosulfolactate phosphatase [Candidatus Zixiibacteriota bacterium]